MRAYFRALARLERRRAAFVSRRPLAYAYGSEPAAHRNHCGDCARAWRLVVEAARTVNEFAPLGRGGL